MRNATRDVLRVSLTVGAMVAVLLSAELSKPRVFAPDDAVLGADAIVHARSILIEPSFAHHDADRSLRTDSEPVARTHALRQRTLLALAQ